MNSILIKGMKIRCYYFGIRLCRLLYPVDVERGNGLWHASYPHKDGLRRLMSEFLAVINILHL